MGTDVSRVVSAGSIRVAQWLGAALVCAAVLTGCVEDSAEDTAAKDWKPGAMKRSLKALDDALLTIRFNNKGDVDRGTCQPLSQWVDASDSEPEPERGALADAWSLLVERATETSGVCEKGTAPELINAVNGLELDIEAVRARLQKT